VSVAGLLRGSDGKDLRGRIAFIGPTALGLGDRFLTPVSAPLRPDPGVTVHAAATESLVRGEQLGTFAPILGGCAAGIVAGAMTATRRRSRRSRILLTAGFIVLLLIGGYAALNAGIAVPFATLMLVIVLSAAGAEASLMTAYLRQSRMAASRLGSPLGLPQVTADGEVGVRLEEIATRLAEVRAQEVESKRLLAHELKTPLASMRGLTQLLAGFELNDVERRRVTSLLENEAGKLQTMVNALLDLERLPLRNFESSTNVVDFGDLVNGRVEMMRASVSGSISLDVTAGVLVRADSVLIERVVDNLVGNAVKYSPRGSPVQVRLTNGGGEATLEVEDRGPGVPPAERERVFQRFFRGSSATGTQGLGLGLSLVAEVARWHRGSVSTEGAEGGGSVFRFVLPLADGGVS
jgi:signal transduction histidine kinase